MKLEISCNTPGCNFHTKIDWNEEKFYGLIVPAGSLDNDKNGSNPLSRHHEASRPSLNEYKNWANGHRDYSAVYKGKVIEIEASDMGAWIKTDISDLV